MAVLFFIGTSLVLVMALGKLLALHSVHSMFWSCAQRTNTNRQTRFENLRRYYTPLKNVALPPTEQDVVTFDFSGNTEVIEIPPGSAWGTIRTCRRRRDMCRDAIILNGGWYIQSTAWWTDPGHQIPELPGNWSRFGRINEPAGRSAYKYTSRLELRGSEEARRVDHVLASAIQDAELYFSLCSTPLWIRALYWLTAKLLPKSADRLVQCVLWVQLRTIFFEHDIWEYRGSCRIFELWYLFLNKPDWVKRFEKWSQYFISRQFLRMCYWLGNMAFGMNEWYPEYELVNVASKEM